MISAVFGDYALAVWTVAVIACFAGGLARGFAGFGAGMIMSPTFVSLFGPAMGVPMMQLIDSLLQLWIVPANFKRIRWKEAWFWAVISIAMMPFGLMLLLIADPVWMTVGISLAAILSGGIIASGWRYRGPQTKALDGAVAASAGLLSGATSMSGPPLILFSMASGDDPERTRARINGFFAITSFGALVLYWAKGLVTVQTIKVTLVLLPVYLLGTIIGHFLFPRASESLFRRIAVCMILIAGSLAILRVL